MCLLNYWSLPPISLKGKVLQDEGPRQGLRFFSDIMQQLQTRNLSLHEKGKIVSHHQSLFSFQNKQVDKNKTYKVQILQKDAISRNLTTFFISSIMNTYLRIKNTELGYKNCFVNMKLMWWTTSFCSQNNINRNICCKNGTTGIPEDYCIAPTDDEYISVWKLVPEANYMQL
jgi:hypothetical protein